MLLKFLIEIEGNTQPDLIHSLDECRKVLMNGGCFLNVGGCTNAHMKPASDEVEDEYRRLWVAANPKATAPWYRD